jgi:uncharacterized pyridoxal phosphate-containing UPF0001 family protein
LILHNILSTTKALSFPENFPLSEAVICGAARLPHLSMGMSHDFEAAIEEGATMVRVGTAVFGERR